MKRASVILRFYNDDKEIFEVDTKGYLFDFRGVDLFIHKIDGMAGWHISEPKTGASLGVTGNTRDKAIDSLCSSGFSVEKINRNIEKTLNKIKRSA